jgi:retron-type reverse transcriptase
LPIISKLFKKLLLKRLKPIIENKNLIPSHQFGFRQQHNTIDQVHRITNVTEEALEGREICSAVFLDVAFDKVWHQGLMSKLNKILPKQYVHLLESCVTGRIFRVKQEDEYSHFKDIKAGVPQGSVLGPVLYLLYTHDIPKGNNITMATFADDTAILAVGREISSSTRRLQSANNRMDSCLANQTE